MSAAFSLISVDHWQSSSLLATCSAHTVGGRNPALPEKYWNHESTVNANRRWFPMASKWCEGVLSISRSWTDRCNCNEFSPFSSRRCLCARGRWRSALRLWASASAAAAAAAASAAASVCAEAEEWRRAQEVLLEARGMSQSGSKPRSPSQLPFLTPFFGEGSPPLT